MNPVRRTPSRRFTPRALPTDQPRPTPLDERYGFEPLRAGENKLGWLINMQPTSIPMNNNNSSTNGEEEDGAAPQRMQAAVDLYFVEENGEMFKATRVFRPYFYVGCREGFEAEVEDVLRRRFEGRLCGVACVVKEDIDLVRERERGIFDLTRAI